jgi:protein-disulfide isomerase
MWQKLRKDISEGIKKYGLNGTPAYVINDQVYFGQIPTDILKKYVQ